MKRSAFLAGLVILAIGLRLAAMSWLPSAPALHSEEQSIAENLATGRGYSFLAFSHLGPTSLRPPVYPLLMGMGYTLLGVTPLADRATLLLNILAAGAGVLAAYALGRRLFRHSCAALLLAGLMAVMPLQVYSSLYLQGLSIAILLTLLSLWLTTYRDPRLALPAGLLAGLAVLTESILVIPLLLVIALIAARRPGFAILMLAGAFTLVTPWIYRNSLVQHQFTPITNEFWSDAFSGNGDGATGSIHQRVRDFKGKPLSRLDQLSPRETDQLKRQPEAVRTQFFKASAMDWIRDHPLDYARLCAVRVAKTLWLDWSHPMAWNIVNVISRTLGVLTLIAAIVLGRRKPAETTDIGPESTPLSLRPLPLIAALMLGLVLASAFTVAEARNSIFVDLPQLLAIALVADRKFG